MGKPGSLHEILADLPRGQRHDADDVVDWDRRFANPAFRVGAILRRFKDAEHRHGDGSYSGGITQNHIPAQSVDRQGGQRVGLV